MNEQQEARERDPARASGSASPLRFVAQRLVLKPLLRTFVDVDVIGREHLRGLDGALVVVANHSSHLDAPLVLCSLPRRLGLRLAVAAAADYFFEDRWRAGFTKAVFNAFPMERKIGRGRLGKAAELLDAGMPLLLFAEGTRSRTGAMARFKPGAAALCLSRDVPCVPIGLRGAFAAMPSGRHWPVRGRPDVAVHIGVPLRAQPGESIRSFSLRMQTAVAELADQVAGSGEPAEDPPRECEA